MSLATITGRWLGETAFVQVSTTLALTCPEMVHQKPCITREIETCLSDIGNSTVVDHTSRRPVLSPLRNCVDRCHLWPYLTSRCKPWRWVLKYISIHRLNWIGFEVYCQLPLYSLETTAHPDCNLYKRDIGQSACQYPTERCERVCISVCKHGVVVFWNGNNLCFSSL